MAAVSSRDDVCIRIDTVHQCRGLGSGFQVEHRSLPPSARRSRIDSWSCCWEAVRTLRNDFTLEANSSSRARASLALASRLVTIWLTLLAMDARKWSSSLLNAFRAGCFAPNVESEGPIAHLCAPLPFGVAELAVTTGHRG